MTNATTNNPTWEIRTLVGLQSGRFKGYTVERIHNPRTSQARVEVMDRGRVFRTQTDALEAIVKATA